MKLLSKYQCGFRPMHSTPTALIDMKDNWYLIIKAFDTISIDHEIVLSKLEVYGFKGAGPNFFRDVLSQIELRLQL